MREKAAPQGSQRGWGKIKAYTGIEIDLDVVVLMAFRRQVRTCKVCKGRRSRKEDADYGGNSEHSGANPNILASPETLSRTSGKSEKRQLHKVGGSRVFEGIVFRLSSSAPNS